MNVWTREQLNGRFTEDQMRFMDFKAAPGGYEVRTSGGELVPPPAARSGLLTTLKEIAIEAAYCVAVVAMAFCVACISAALLAPLWFGAWIFEKKHGKP